MVAPKEVQQMGGFPDTFNFCSQATMEAAPAHIRRDSSFIQGTTNRCENFEDPTCITHSLDTVRHYYYGNMYPGWCTDSFGSLGVFNCNTAGNLLGTGGGDNIAAKTPVNTRARRWCGTKIGGTLNWPSTRPPVQHLPGKVPHVPASRALCLCATSAWASDPSGDVAELNAYFYYTTTTREEICPGLVFALTAALGSMAQIELACTMLFGGLLMALCLLKPSNGHEGSNLMTLLKGSAMTSIDKKVLAIEAKLGMSGSTTIQKVKPAQEA